MSRTIYPSFLVLGMFFLRLSPACGATFRVDSAVDARDADPTDGICDDGTGLCTLRAAIEQANANEDTDSVILGETTYFLTEGVLRIRRSLRILGKGIGLSVIDGNGASGVLEVDSPSQSAARPRVTIKNVTITHGRQADGAGLSVGEGTVTVEGSAIILNVADGVTSPSDFPLGCGGGVFNWLGVVNIRDSVISEMSLQTVAVVFITSGE